MTVTLSKTIFYEMAINFENSKDLDEMRQMTREAREIILQKVKLNSSLYFSYVSVNFQPEFVFSRLKETMKGEKPKKNWQN